MGSQNVLEVKKPVLIVRPEDGLRGLKHVALNILLIVIIDVLDGNINTLYKIIFKGWNVHLEYHMVLFLKGRHNHPMICGATFQKNRGISVNQISTASVNAVLTVFTKLERHPHILLWITASVTMELTSIHECQPLKFMIPSHLNPMSPTNSKKNKKTVFFTTLSDKCTIYVNNHLFLITLLHVSMFIHNPQVVSCYVCRSYKINKMETFIQEVITEI